MIKTYSAYYIADTSTKLFEGKKGAEMYGQLPVGVRLVNRKVVYLNDMGVNYQCFATREGPIIAVVEDKEGVKINPTRVTENYCTD